MQWLGESCFQGLVVTLDLNITCIDVLVKFLSSKYYRESFLLYLSVVALELYITGKPSWRSTAPNPVSDTSHWRTTRR